MRIIGRFAGLACALALTGASASAQFSLSTIYAANNGGSSGGIVYFDLTVANPVLITAFDMNYDPGYAPTGQPVGLQVFTTPGTYVGNESNQSAWTQVAMDNGQATAAGVLNTPTNIQLAQPLLMQSGTQGVALVAVQAGHDYTNGNGTNQTYSDNFLTIQCGAANNSPWASNPFTPRVWNGGIHYVPADGLYSNFTATPTSGPSPLAVQFTDTTFTSDPAGVATWAWDFESDGIVDSTIQNPPHTYNTCGYQDVTLTTTNTLHPPSTLTKTAFITVDPQLLVTADFTANATTVTAPGIVNFTDTSVGNPTTWAWDLDGDTVVDSTVQNPSFTYNLAGRFDVTLTAGNACGGHTVTKTEFVTVVGATSNTESPELLEFQFNETRGDRVANSASTTIAPEFGTVLGSDWQGDAGRSRFMGNEAGFGCMLADNLAPYESKVDSGWTIDITGSHTIMFWSRVNSASPGTSYVFGGSSGSARCYNVGYLSLRTWGSLPAFIDSSTDPDLLTGWNHWAVVVDDAAGTGQWYLNGVADGAMLSFPPGTFTMSGFGTFIIGTYGTTTSMFSRYHDMDDFRVYARALTAPEIQVGLLDENATTSRYAGGCAGLSGVPTIGANSAPTLGNNGFAITLANAEVARGGLLVLGAQSHTWLSVVPLPFDLSFLFGSGCGLQTGLDVLIPINTGGGSMNVPFPIPAGFAGSHGYAQFLILGTQGAVTAGLDINIELP